LLFSCQHATTSAPVTVTVDIPTGGGSAAPLAGVWIVESLKLSFDLIAVFRLTFDDNLAATAISYRFNGSFFSFFGAQITRGAQTST